MFNGKTKKKKSKGKRNASHPHHHPHHAGHHKHKHGHRNTSRAHAMGGRQDMGMVAAGGGGALAAGLGSHLIAEQFLTAYNSGPLGWLVTAVLGGLISWGGSKVFGRRFFFGGVAGTALAVGYRIVEDIGVTPAKSVAADIRDAQANAASAPALPAAGVSGTGMGTPVAWPWPKQPQIYAAPSLGRIPAKGQRALVRR